MTDIDALRFDASKLHSLRTATDAQLLRELLRRNPVQQGPTATQHAGTYRIATVGIGRDNTAIIGLHIEDIEALKCDEQVGTHRASAK